MMIVNPKTGTLPVFSIYIQVSVLTADIKMILTAQRIHPMCGGCQTANTDHTVLPYRNCDFKEKGESRHFGRSCL